jgi:hypothetical protein
VYRVFGFAVFTWLALLGFAQAHEPICYGDQTSSLKLLVEHNEVAYAVGTSDFISSTTNERETWSAKFWASERGTWTVVMTSPDGQRSCWYSMGRNFKRIGKLAKSTRPLVEEE